MGLNVEDPKVISDAEVKLQAIVDEAIDRLTTQIEAVGGRLIDKFEVEASGLLNTATNDLNTVISSAVSSLEGLTLTVGRNATQTTSQKPV